jgi:hypothetical protein
MIILLSEKYGFFDQPFLLQTCFACAVDCEPLMALSIRLLEGAYPSSREIWEVAA